MTAISLRGLISFLCAAAVAVVAIITLSITLTTSLSALRDIGKTHASSLVTNAVFQTEVFLRKPARMTEAARNFSLMYNWDHPSDNVTVRNMYRALLYTQLVECGSDCTYVLYFADSTHMNLVGQGGSNTYYGYIKYGAPYSIGGLPHQLTQPVTTEVLLSFWSNHRPFVYPLNWTWIPKPLLRNSSLWDTLTGYTDGGTNSSLGYPLTLSFGGLSIASYLVYYTPLYTMGTPRVPSNLFGIAVGTIDPAAVSTFLKRIGGTPNTQTVSYDDYGYLIASSLDESFQTVTIPDKFTPVDYPRCSASNATALSTGPNYLNCRASFKAYGGPALRAIAADASFAFSASPTVKMLNVDGDFYYTAVSPVKLQYGGMRLWVAITIPEADVIGDVVTGRNTAIGITIAVFVLMAVLSFVLISLLLAPLSKVADRMMQAASLEDDDTTREFSAMAEVEDLQQAYYAMNDELIRIRSFVPQTVLKKRSDDEDLTDLRTSEVGSTRSNSKRSQSQSRARSERSHTVIDSESALNVTCGLTPQSASVVVANLCGFEAAVETTSRDAVATALGDTIAMVQEVATANKGVLQSFHGDHFVVTFNAVTNCAAHARRAAVTALHLADGARGVGMKIDLRAGVASGRCLVGNVGSATAKGFSTIGSAFMHATVLERLTRLYGPGCRVLAPWRTCADVATHVQFRCVDIIELPRSKRPTLIGALLSELKESTGNAALNASTGQQDGEWLYVVQQKGSDAMINDAFTAVLEGRLDALRALMTKIDEGSVRAGGITSYVQELAQRAVQGDFASQGGSYAVRGRDLGPFYNLGYGV